MARNVKKVKVQRKKHSKKFWAILWSSIVGGVAIIATVIVLLFVFVINNEDEYDYFASIIDDASITTGELVKAVESDSYEHIFVFYWSKSLDPEDNKTDKAIEEKVISLYNTVLKYNETEHEESIVFYLLDTNTNSGNAALTNESLGNIESANQLCYYYNGTLQSYAYGSSKNESGNNSEISGSSTTEITAAIAFVKSFN